MILAYALLTIFAFVRLGYCLTCANGGQVVALGCTNSLQCAPYTRAPVACISSQCCTVPHTCPNLCRPLALGCTSAVQCLPYAGTSLGITCINGMCCPV
ncbi:unnamed protein product [Enterobius vermicularis]|uniref:CC domain-containing protein n=1 Tax=Enterobius vermicularis TaxID=51028 RepID=A0A0N4UV09_ENTVE|nr:unnamed protein product [Enterobius vermicularis]